MLLPLLLQFSTSVVIFAAAADVAVVVVMVEADVVVGDNVVLVIGPGIDVIVAAVATTMSNFLLLLQLFLLR